MRLKTKQLIYNILILCLQQNYNEQNHAEGKMRYIYPAVFKMHMFGYHQHTDGSENHSRLQVVQFQQLTGRKELIKNPNQEEYDLDEITLLQLQNECSHINIWRRESAWSVVCHPYTNVFVIIFLHFGCVFFI